MRIYGMAGIKDFEKQTGFNADIDYDTLTDAEKSDIVLEINMDDEKVRWSVGNSERESENLSQNGNGIDDTNDEVEMIDEFSDTECVEKIKKLMQ